MQKLSPASWLVSAGRPRGTGRAAEHAVGTGLQLPARRRVASIPATAARRTWEALEDIIGNLEGGEALTFSSGMAAAAAVFDQLESGASSRAAG